MLLQFTLIRRFKTKQNIRLWVSSSVPSGLGFFLHFRSVAALHHHLVAWNRLPKHWKTNQARVVHSCFMAALLPRIWNVYYDMFQWRWFRRSIDVIFYCFREKSPAGVTKLPAVACSRLLFWTLQYINNLMITLKEILSHVAWLFSGSFHFSSFFIVYRTVCSTRTSLALPSMFTGLVLWESPIVTTAVNAGISLSTVLSVQGPFQSTVLCTWITEVVRIPIASAISRGTATTSTKARCALDSGSLIVLDSVEVMTPTLDTFQFPGSLLKKFQNLKLRYRDKST